MLKIKKLINELPIEIQLLILEYYNEVKEYFIINVLPLLLPKNRIRNHYNENEFLYMTNMKHHYLINVSNIINLVNDTILMECTLNISIPRNIKNIWIRIHITSIINYFGGMNNSLVEVLYINKYNYNFFAIKSVNECTNVGIFEPLKKIYLSNYCNYYSCDHFMHLPENAIELINNYP
jgi:hypothetical protein